MKKISSGLPMELVTEVLIRLPVKSLARCRCVCKAWCSLISTPDFASMHLIRLHNNEDHPMLLTLYNSGRKTLCTLRSALTYKKVINYKIPITKHLENLKNYCMYKICYADGLILMTKTLTSEILLWNPSLGKALKLPPIWSYINKAFFGLGFDSARNDYKVVAIGKYPRMSVQIYELRAPFWRTITNCNCEESLIQKVDSDGLLMEGTIHWIAQDSDITSRMVLFDVNNEVFNYIILPEEVGEYCEHTYPIMYRGKLGLLHVFDGHLCSLWVTDRDQVPGAWVKLYEVNLAIDDRLSYRHHFHFLSFRENGQLIFATTKGGGVKLHDFESQEMKQLLKTFPYGMMYSIPYKESVVLM